MKILVSLGGTREKIDNVRYLGNYSTGKLGKTIAEKFADNGAEVVAICASHCDKPVGCKVKEFVNYADFESIFSAELVKNYDVIIHLAALSDYTVKNQFDGKIDSNNNFTIQLEPTKKLINTVKDIAPKSKLVGFKLLANVSEEELLEVAKKSMQKTRADIVVANRKEDVTKDRHIAYMISQNDVAKCCSKEEIAEKLLGELL